MGETVSNYILPAPGTLCMYSYMDESGTDAHASLLAHAYRAGDCNAIYK